MCERIKNKLKDLPEDNLNMYLKTTTKVFNFFLECCDIKNVDKPMTDDTFRNPYSIEVMILLYLYSMEPPFYFELNQACRTLDHSQLNTLGPYAAAIGMLLGYGW